MRCFIRLTIQALFISLDCHREIERMDGTIPEATVCGVPGMAFVPASRCAVRARLYTHQQLADVTRERLLHRPRHVLPRLTVAISTSVSSGAASSGTTEVSTAAVQGSERLSQSQGSTTNTVDVDLRTADIQSVSGHDSEPHDLIDDM